MDRRKTLKLMVAGSAATGLVLTGCDTSKSAPETGQNNVDLENDMGYGRTDEELVRDKARLKESFFSDHDLATITVLADIIVPADGEHPSASKAGVVEFIDFMALDRPTFQVPLSGGLKWLDHESNVRFGKVFKDASADQQIEIVDDIAYPEDAKPEMSQGVKFFSTMRDLVLTGYFTSKPGLEDLGFMGNVPNVWDGVPQEVLDKHNLAYDEKTLKECIDQSTRNEIMDWTDYKL